jgi:hypothetical protein
LDTEEVFELAVVGVKGRTRGERSAMTENAEMKLLVEARRVKTEMASEYKSWRSHLGVKGLASTDMSQERRGKWSGIQRLQALIKTGIVAKNFV